MNFKIIVNDKIFIVKPTDNPNDSILKPLGLNIVPLKELTKIIKNNNNNENICIICQENFKGKTNIQLNCKHIFHKKCINKWLKINYDCPLCRQSIY